MNEKLTRVINSSKQYLSKHSPEILTGIGITGMITSTVLAVSATPKALNLIDIQKKKLKTDELTTLETIKAAWKPYVPAISLSIVSTACLIGASAVNAKRNAALATAYAISERTLVRYRDKVIETLGEKKEKEVRDKIAQEEVDNNKVSNSQIIVTSKGNTLCMDSLNGRYFKSDIDKINKAVNELNRQLTYQNYVSLNDFYYELGLDGIKNGSLLGWNLDDGLIKIDFSSCLAEDGTPCLVIDYAVMPKYDYDKFM